MQWIFFLFTAAHVTTDLRETGRVLTLGQGDVGQLGLGEDILERKKPAIVKGLDDLDIVQVECGGMHTVALTNKGKVITTKLVIQTNDFVIFIVFALQVKFTMMNPWQLICNLKVRIFLVTHDLEMYCVVPENIQPLWKFQLRFIHFFKFFGLKEPPTSHEISIPFVRIVWIFSGTAHCQCHNGSCWLSTSSSSSWWDYMHILANLS